MYYRNRPVFVGSKDMHDMQKEVDELRPEEYWDYVRNLKKQFAEGTGRGKGDDYNGVDYSNVGERLIVATWFTGQRETFKQGRKLARGVLKKLRPRAQLCPQAAGLGSDASSDAVPDRPAQAGRTIFPVLPYLSREQESYLVRSLEPGMRSLYQKAYMLREYDRPAAKAALGDIVRSDLRILPSFEKAKGILEYERKVESALGTITRQNNEQY